MKPITVILLIICTTTFSQSIDYNVKKGFVANGYDVVAYFQGKALVGNKKFISQFDGVKYKFANPENLETFQANPQKFIPQYGGYCAYAIAIKADKVSINPESYLITDDKLYLFYNAWGTDTLILWKAENEKDLITKANTNWGKIKLKK